MKKSILAMLNILLSFSTRLVAPAPDNHKANNGSDAQADATDPFTADQKLASSKFENEFSGPRWIYRGHYRSIFPPRF